MVFLSLSELIYYVSYYIVTVFDLETKDMHIQKQGSALLEIDLPARLWQCRGVLSSSNCFFMP